MPVRFQVNKGTLFVNVVNQVNSSEIRKEVIKGEAYFVVPSWTLPDDIVMNGGLYPAAEIERSFMSLNGTHAPIEHPKNSDGEYILAVDPEAMVNGYLIGAKNKNVRREGGRVYAEKWIPERIANGCDKGKRLLDRLNALMNGKGEPIHTSTGVLLEREDVYPPLPNKDGVSYTWIAKNMVFDHDAILLDSPGAATPADGVGMGVNSAQVEGSDIERIIAVIHECVNSQELDMGTDNLPDKTMSEDGEMEEPEEIEEPEEDKPSKIDALIMLIKALFAGNDKNAYNTNDDKVNPITHKQEGTRMDKIIAALTAKGIQTNGLDDDQLLAEYNKMVLADSGDAMTKAVNAAIAPLAKQVESLQTALAANADKEKTSLIEQLVSADVGLDADDLNGLAVNALQKLHAKHCQSISGLNGSFNQKTQLNEFEGYSINEMMEAK